jgi:hypothetical protein
MALSTDSPTTGKPQESPDSSPILVNLLLAVAAGALTIAAVAAVGWYLSATSLDLDKLSPSERRSLAEKMLEISPGIYLRTWFQPEIAYVLKRDADLEAWDDTFHSNEIGYRTGPVEKRKGTFRIVCVGDSWTYGMGIKEEESFPKVLERLANAYSGSDRQVETFTLALPGYNTINQLAAFWFYFDQLEADAVVLVPSSNDNSSSPQILPNGALGIVSGPRGDEFGDPHNVQYRLLLICNSYRYLQRWQHCFSLLRATEQQLQQHEIPVAFFFLARWDTNTVHRFIGEAGIESPYTVVAPKLTLNEWLTDLPNPHGNITANKVYGQLLYRLLSRRLGWQPLPASALHPEAADLPLFAAPPEGADWKAETDRMFLARVRRVIPESFNAGASELAQWAGPGDIETGAFGRATTLLISSAPNARRVRIRVRRLQTLHGIYPLKLTAAIPSANGGTQVTTTIPATGSNYHELTLPIPEDLEPGVVLDIVLTADRVAVEPGTETALSVAVDTIEQLP